MSYAIEDYSERNFARAEEEAADAMDAAGLIFCEGCDEKVLRDETELVPYLYRPAGAELVPLALSVDKIRLCSGCAPRCTLCDGLLDHGSLFEESFQRTQDEMNVGMGVMVVTTQGKMHGGCAAALMLGESDGEDLALLSNEEIAAAYTRMVKA